MQSKTDIDNGKYTIVHDSGTGLHILRHGKDWIGEHDWPLPEKLLLACSAEIDQLREDRELTAKLLEAALDDTQKLRAENAELLKKLEPVAGIKHQPDTLGYHRVMSAAIFGEDSKATKYLDSKIAQSPNGAAEVVIVDERQVVGLLITLHNS